MRASPRCDVAQRPSRRSGRPARWRMPRPTAQLTWAKAYSSIGVPRRTRARARGWRRRWLGSSAGHHVRREEAHLARLPAHGRPDARRNEMHLADATFRDRAEDLRDQPPRCRLRGRTVVGIAPPSATSTLLSAASRGLAAPDHDELRVVRAGTPGAHVEQAIVERADEPVLEKRAHYASRARRRGRGPSAATPRRASASPSAARVAAA